MGFQQSLPRQEFASVRDGSIPANRDRFRRDAESVGITQTIFEIAGCD
jgi:hypothetical protein